jgi:hypothetical protein
MGWRKNLLLILVSSLFSNNKSLLLFEKTLFSLMVIKVIIIKWIILSYNSRLEACSSVDRASDSDSESQGFKSLHAYD